jgi:hypothetical protein
MLRVVSPPATFNPTIEVFAISHSFNFSDVFRQRDARFGGYY